MGEIVRFWRAVGMLRSGRTEEGLDALRAVARDEPNDPYLLNNVGSLLTNHGHPREALPLLQRAAMLAPDAESRLALAATLARLDRKPEAVETLTELTRLSPALLVARLTLAEMLVDLGRNDEAVPHLEAFLAEIAGEGPLRERAEALLRRARS
jgi:predicted Zn-dependent protease